MDDNRNNNNRNNNRYFQDALSDFMFDAASGRAIRHLIDTGYTAAQIMQQLNYPTPFVQIQKTVTRYLKESGILLEELPLPPAYLQTVRLKRLAPEKLFSFLSERVTQNGEENSYLSCPFGTACSHEKDPIRRSFPMLMTRELEYLESIAWEPGIMYHRLNRRMLEIGVQIAADPDAASAGVCFYFLKSKEIFTVQAASLFSGFRS